MPKIKTYPRRIGGRLIKFNLKYGVKSHKFTIEFPSWMAGVLGREGITGTNQVQVETRLHESIEEYGVIESTKEKVIFYSFKSMIRPLNFDGPNQAVGRSQMCSMGVALDLWFQVGYEIKNPTKESWHTYVDENYESTSFLKHRMTSLLHMSWTEEREKFFTAFRQYLINGIERMQEFFKDKAALPEMMDTVVMKKQLPFIQSSEVAE